MTKSHSTKARICERAPFAMQAPIISHDDSQQDPAGQRTLYGLGFGIAGAILANMLVFIYFASFYASG
jgi:hypothetical protein